MGIIVPILRILFVSLNIYETFKTLKMPLPSARNGGQPSVRAMSQRKRAMKGSLAVWLIWCCFALYERTVDGVIGIFIPFYSEIKAIVIIFFLLTRAKGAEPIYLHVLRPLIKPYTATLDLLFDLFQHLTDLVFVFLAVPVHFMTSIWHRWSSPSEPGPEEALNQGEQESSSQSAYGATRTRRRPLQEAYGRTNSASNNATASEQAQQFWRPPPSAYEDSPPTAPKGLPTPPSEDQLHLVRDHVAEEWRKYEPFPAAYPATPIYRLAHLPINATLQPYTLDDIGEEPPVVPPLPTADVLGTGQDFPRSIQSSRECLNPTSADGLSDDQHETQGVHTDDEMSVDDEEEDFEDEEEEEDDFNLTLRTPYVHKMSRVENVSNMTAQSELSTALSTVDNGSPFRTRTNSEASNSMPEFETTSLAGKKRPLPPTLDPDATIRAPTTKAVDNETVRPKPMKTKIRPAIPVRTKSQATESSASGTENREEDCKGATSIVKKRRVGTVTQVKKEPIRRAPLQTGGATARQNAVKPVRPAPVRKTTAVPRPTQPRVAPVRPPIKKVASSGSKLESSSEGSGAAAVPSPIVASVEEAGAAQS